MLAMPHRYLLALESSCPIASVSLAQYSPDSPVDPLRQLSGETLAQGERTAQGLLPAIHRCLQSADVVPADLSLMAVVSGPGSFTGLRIGVTAAKTLAYATGATLVGVNTLDLLAYQATRSGLQSSSNPTIGRVWAVLDAQRGDLFAASYAAIDIESLGVDDPTQLLAGADWLAQLTSGDVVVGPATSKYAEQLPEGVRLAKPDHHQPQSAAVGELGYLMWRRNLQASPFELAPQYHRLSAAEEKARSQNAN